jgi:hypothetical protein
MAVRSREFGRRKKRAFGHLPRDRAPRLCPSKYRRRSGNRRDREKSHLRDRSTSTFAGSDAYRELIAIPYYRPTSRSTFGLEVLANLYQPLAFSSFALELRAAPLSAGGERDVPCRWNRVHFFSQGVLEPRCSHRVSIPCRCHQRRAFFSTCSTVSTSAVSQRNLIASSREQGSIRARLSQSTKPPSNISPRVLSPRLADPPSRATTNAAHLFDRYFGKLSAL